MNATEQAEFDKQQYYKRRQLFEEMLLTPAWKEFEAILQAQRAVRIEIILKAINPEQNGTAQMLNDMYYKGVAYGIQLTLETPHDTITTAKEILQAQGNKQDAERIDNDGNNLPESAIVRDLSGDDQ